MVDDTGTRLESSDVWHLNGPVSLEHVRDCTDACPPAPGEGLIDRVLRSGDPTWATLAAEPGSVANGGAPRATINAVMAFPVKIQDEVVALLEFFCARSVGPNERLLDVMIGVSAQLGRIVERDRAVATLRRTEPRHRMLADSIPALVWAAGSDGQYTFVNRGWLEFTGRTLAQTIGDGWAESIHEDDLTRCIDAYHHALGKNKPVDREYRLRRADGEYRTLIDHGMPVLEHGIVTGYVGICIDVTDRRRIESHRGGKAIALEARMETLI
jgi:PAS domain S-box-containing protein